ncbi:hypothetical protein [Mycoplasma sp. CB776]
MIKNKVCMMKINKKTIMVFSVPIIALTLGITTTSILITKKINNEKINKQNNQLKSFIYNQPNSELDSLLEKFYFKFINNNDLNLYQKEKLSLNLQKFVSEYNAFLSKPLTLLNSRIEKKYPDLLKKSNELIEFKNKIKKIVSNINLNNFNFEDNTNQLIEKNKDIVYINQQNKNLNDELDIFSTKINSTNFYNNFLLKLVDKNFLNDIMDVNFSYSNYFQKIKNLDLEINEIKDTISFLDFYFEKSDSNLKNEIKQITTKYKEKIQEKSVFSLSLSRI